MEKLDISEVYSDLKDKNIEQVLHELLLSKVDILKNTKAEEMLSILYSNSNTLKMTELQSMLQLTQHKFYEELARLDGAGLIEKRRSPRDNRYMVVNLTKEGLYIMQNIKEEK